MRNASLLLCALFVDVRVIAKYPTTTNNIPTPKDTATEESFSFMADVLNTLAIENLCIWALKEELEVIFCNHVWATFDPLEYCSLYTACF